MCQYVLDVLYELECARKISNCSDYKIKCSGVGGVLKWGMYPKGLIRGCT